MTKDIHSLTKLVTDFRDERDWKQFHNPKDAAISLLLESAEFLEHFQWKNPEEIVTHLREKKSGVEDELADVLYWVLLLAHDLDIDLDTALQAKLQKSAQKYPIEKAKGRHTKYTEL